MNNFIYPKFVFLYLAGFFEAVTLISSRKILAFSGSLDAMLLLNLIHKKFQKCFHKAYLLSSTLSSGLFPGGQLI